MTDHKATVDLLIVGGLTIDRFTDGTSAPGGTVIHAGSAVVPDGIRQATLTAAGVEPEAAVGLARLESFGPVVRQAAPSTTTYRHGERDGRRALVFECGTAPIGPESLAQAPRPQVALLAPIGDELPAATVDRLRAELTPQLTVLLIQGWLRRLIPGREVEPLPLDEVSPDLWRVFSEADAVVLSTEDLPGPATDPFIEAADLRRRLGSRPILLLTLGTEGYVLDDPALDRVLASVPRTVVTGVPTVGAGDTFGAALAVHLGRGEDASTAARAATERVISVFEARRR
ncbi:MAG: PfkB family carbohydrate kinase [Chloroflexota bacterium]